MIAQNKLFTETSGIVKTKIENLIGFNFPYKGVNNDLIYSKYDYSWEITDTEKIILNDNYYVVDGRTIYSYEAYKKLRTSSGEPYTELFNKEYSTLFFRAYVRSYDAEVINITYRGPVGGCHILYGPWIDGIGCNEE